MKAAIRRDYCLPDQISVEEIDQPSPKDNEVLIEVYASTVNRTDCAILTGKPFIMRFFQGLVRPKKIVLGTDFAGKVVSVGKKVKSYREGDRLFGFDDSGIQSQAQFTSIKEDNLFPIPENINFKDAAASLEGANYAYSFIRKSNIQPGQRILINGATGAIGSALLQFTRQFDVEITATSDSKNIELIKSLGADKVIDYTKDDFTKDSLQYDFVFDAVGKCTLGKCKPILKPKGVYISSELGPNSQNIFYSIFTKRVIFPVPYSRKVSIPYFIEQLKKEKFKPIIDREYPLEKTADAYEYVLKGEKTGNVILKV
ncbi:NAD(P)-dependent alcohol dehydrogenase [Salibacter halophilus]|uniref:NAD(P)-dependent alcohol dehydrogenase n=1 Tax=Salibacter halophilus TaxID=1803916 RepID=A0A6N6MA20_9FLAO|nr:NAD(P)-dependent alcohol dehydrogenase [Salibacter halophilus]KAB1065560.1 NAD(P)-dependent alcohol dehydrogenase [Salibacter halophilus]